MISKQEKQKRVKIKRLQIRGDEIAILFFSLVFLVFLLFSFFRLFAIGKLFDDFIFTFLFGWTKYSAYTFLFIVLLPIFFNFYFRIKASVLIGAFFTLFIASWFVQNIATIITMKNKLLWREWYFYRLENVSDYFFRWWDTTIINNYHGFFAQPISFADWNNVATFFPSFATGGIVAHFLTYLFAFGGFVTVLAVSSALLLIGLTWVIFGKPWFFFLLIFCFIIPIVKLLRKRKIKRLSEHSLASKETLDQADVNITPTGNSPLRTTEGKQTIKAERKTQELKQENILQDMIQESGTLAPFGQVLPKKNSEENEEN